MGWCKLKRIIAHKLAPEKRMFHITAGTGQVTVTEDHSLLTSSLQEIKPTTIANNPHTDLLHTHPNIYSSEVRPIFVSKYDAYELGREKTLDQRILNASTASKIEFLNGWKNHI